MKNKIILATLLAIYSCVGIAGSASRTADQYIGTPVPISKYPRVVSFSEWKYYVTEDGKFLICSDKFKSKFNINSCTDTNGRNAWAEAENFIPGFTLSAYEFRFTGSSGYRTLVLYYSK